MTSPFGVDDLLEHGLEPVFELTAVFGAGDEGAHIEGDEAPALEDLGDIAAGDALGEALGDRGLADPRFTDEHRVVFGSAGQDLHETPDLLVATDDRIDLAGVGELGEVAAVVLERLIFGLGIFVGDPVRPAQFLDCGQEVVVVDSLAGEGSSRGGVLDRHDGEQKVLNRDELILKLWCELGRLVEYRPITARRLRIGPAFGGWEPVEGGPKLFRERPSRSADFGEKFRRDALVLFDQGLEKVSRGGFRVAAGGRGLEAGLQGFGRPQSVLIVSVHFVLRMSQRQYKT